MVTREHLGEAFEIDRVLFRQRLAGVGQECRRIDANCGKGIDSDCRGPWRVPRVGEKLIRIFARDTEREEFFVVQDAQIVRRRIYERLLQRLVHVQPHQYLTGWSSDRSGGGFHD